MVLLDLEPSADPWGPREFLSGRIAEFGGFIAAGPGLHFVVIDGSKKVDRWQGTLESHKAIHQLDRIG